MIGSLLAQYRITKELGRGGMGIVYGATDTKLNRTVAIKVLPAAALASEEDRARFFREAQAAAQLHHPNIATVFQIDEAIPVDASGTPARASHEPRPFIAMEFIDGETLQDRIKEGPLRLPEAVRIAAQVAEALKAAHAKQIVHRDIKPANIMLTGEGVAKVLDFGLAKTGQRTVLTRTGSTLGTIDYMSPEQARGQEVDGRSDLYSLGTVLYEMIAGRRPFRGDFEQAIVYALLNDMPEALTAVRTGVPMGLEWIVDKLLSKEPHHRYQTAADLIADLETVDLSESGQTRRMRPASGITRTAVAPGARSHQRMPLWGWAAVVAALVVGGLGAWMLKPDKTGDEDTVTRELMLEFPQFAATRSYAPSPDGRILAFSATDSLGTEGIYVLNLETGNLRAIPGVSGAGLGFSPDGSRMLYTAQNINYVVPTTGGSSVPIEQSLRFETAWLGDGRLIYVHEQGNSVWIIPENGRDPYKVVGEDTSNVRFFDPSPLPGDTHALIVTRDFPGTPEMHVLDLRRGDLKFIGLGGYLEYMPSTGHVLYKTGDRPFFGPLVARPFNLDRLEFDGPAVTLRQEIRGNAYGFDRFGTWYESKSGSGSRDEATATNVFSLTASGPVLTFTMDKQIEDPRLSRDGKRLVYAVDAERSNEDWLEMLDLASGVARQITFSGDADWAAWNDAHPDQLMVEIDYKLQILSADDLGLRESLPIDVANEFDWSPDARYVVYVATTSNYGPLRLYDRETGADSLLDESARYPRFSPDGRFVAYTKQYDDGYRPVVRSVQGAGFSALNVTDASNGQPVWSRDGRSIFVRGFFNQVGYRVPVDITGSFVQTGPAERLFDIDSRFWFAPGPDDALYVMTADDDLVPTNRFAGGQTARVRVIINWDERLKRLAPRAN